MDSSRRMWCKLCLKNFAGADSYLNHVHLMHINYVNSILSCPNSSCELKFKTYDELQHHVRFWDHKTKKYQVIIQISDFCAFFCTREGCSKCFPFFEGLENHLQFHIAHKEFINCPFLNCKSKFNKLDQYRAHKIKEHKGCKVEAQPFPSKTPACTGDEILAKKPRITSPNSTSTSSNYLQPVIDFQELQDKCDLESVLDPFEKDYILNVIVGQVVKKHRLKKNLKLDSWTFVARQVAEKNVEFFDPAVIGTDVRGINVSVTAKRMHDYAMHIINYENSIPSVSQVPQSAKIIKLELQNVRNAYGRNSFNYSDLLVNPGNMELSIICLQNEFKLKPADRNSLLVFGKMMQVFLKIHFDINMLQMNVMHVKAKYPFFCEPEYLIHYFERLTDICANSELRNFVDNLLLHAYNYMTRQAGKYGCAYSEKAMMEIDKKLAAAEKESGTSNQPKFLAVLMMAYLWLYGEEICNLDNVIICVKGDLKDEEIKSEICVPQYPSLVAIGKCAFTANVFVVCVAGQPLSRHSTMSSALCYCFAAFYSFNICYPSRSSLFWEFVQRAIFGLNPKRDSIHERGVSMKGEDEPTISIKVRNLIYGIKKLKKMYDD